MRQHSARVQAPLTPSCPSRAEFGQRLRQSLSKFARKKRMFPASECLESSVVVLRTAVYPALAPLPFSYSSSCSLLTNKGVEFVLTLFRLLRQPANGSKNMSGPAQKWVALGVGVKLLELQGKGSGRHRHVVDFSEGCCSQVQRTCCLCPHREHCAGAQHFAS